MIGAVDLQELLEKEKNKKAVARAKVESSFILSVCLDEFKSIYYYKRREGWQS